MKEIVNLHNWMPHKSIAFTKFDIAHMLLAVKTRMTACSKEKRTWFKKSSKLYYKLQYFRKYRTQKTDSVFFCTHCIDFKSKYFQKSH